MCLSNLAVAWSELSPLCRWEHWGRLEIACPRPPNSDNRPHNPSASFYAKTILLCLRMEKTESSERRVVFVVITMRVQSQKAIGQWWIHCCEIKIAEMHRRKGWNGRCRARGWTRERAGGETWPAAFAGSGSPCARQPICILLSGSWKLPPSILYSSPLWPWIMHDQFIMPPAEKLIVSLGYIY